MWHALQHIDRRIIYALLLTVCVYALLKPMGLPISVNDSTQMCYDEIQKLQPGDIVYLGQELSPSGVPELIPAFRSTVKLVFERGARIVTGAMWTDGPALCRPVIEEVAEQMGKVYGVDYVNLGYRSGGQVFLERAVVDISEAAIGADENGTPLGDLELMADFPNLSAAKLIFIYTSGDPGMQAYIKVVGDRYDVPICQSCVSVSVPEAMPYLRSGQLAGLLMGMRGAAEFEILAKMPGSAVAGMDAQSLSHVLIIGFIALGNLAYVFGGRKGGKAK